MLAILGTESDSGKTQIVAGLSYMLRNYNPFPFKAQNMSLNAYVGTDNGEMAFAQSWQAMAGRTAPVSFMNPVLLKPVLPGKTEVVLLGRSVGIMEAKEYWVHHKRKLKGIVFELFSELLQKQKLILVEGAGGCCEMNFKKEDFANLELCRKFKIPFILVVDIDRGGAFAKIIGSYELMNTKERELLQGIIINKMSGDHSLLAKGIKFIERKIRKKVIGIVRFVDDLNLPEEDSMMFYRRNRISSDTATAKKRKATNGGEESDTPKIIVKVVRTPYISNFFDLFPLALDENFELSWASSRSELADSDIIVLAGSRNVFVDLKFIRARGLDEEIKSAIKKGKLIIAICGGYEMLFEKIKDEYGIESTQERQIEGLGIIKGQVNFRKEKIVGWETINVRTDLFSGAINGFNLRHGDSEIKYFSDKNIFGCFLHSIFWNDEFLRALSRKFGVKNFVDIKSKLESELKKWANYLKEDVDFSYIRDIIRIN